MNKYVNEKLFSQNLTPAQQKDKERLDKEIEKLNKELEAYVKSPVYNNAFEWRFEFPEVLDDEGNFIGFDVVIGNPPYIRAEDLNKDLKILYNSNFKTAVKQYDILVLFFERGLDILKNNYPLSFIVSNKFLISDYGEKLRQLILDSTNFLEAVDISYDNVFKEASVYPYIITLKKDDNATNRNHNIINFKPSLLNGSSIAISQSHFLAVPTPVFDFTSYRYLWMKQIEKDTLPLGKVLKITRGFRPPKSELKVAADNSEKYLIGSDINSYSIDWSGNSVIYNEKEIEESKPIHIFKKDKILFRDIGLKFNAVYDDQGFLCLKTIYFGYSLNEEFSLKFINGLLNSNLLNKYFSNKYSIAHIAGGYLRFRKQFVENLPIKKFEKKEQQPIIDLVNQILISKKENPKADTSQLEKQIDDLVYKLYNLTPEEIQTIESSIK